MGNALARGPQTSDLGGMQDHLSRMCEIATHHTRGVLSETVLPRIALHTGQKAVRPTHNVYEPATVLVLQGAKQVTIGDRVLRYDSASCFITTLALPANGWVVEGTPEKPYIAVSLRLDRAALAALIVDMPPALDGETSGFAVSAVTPELLDAWSRLLSLLDRPADAAVLAPMHEREVLYRLLQGPQGGALRQIARLDSRLNQIGHAIGWIRAHYERALRTEELARLAGMSPASFHRHFKAATAMSPLQYQKSLRLQEARRLLATSTDAAHAGHSVGYESASHFSRDYARMFGAPPRRDAVRLRGQSGDLSDAA